MGGLRVDARIERLSVASTNRVIEPDDEVQGCVGDGAVLPPELLSIAGLDLDLTPQELATLSREEMASFLQTAMRFEALAMSAFTMQIAAAPNLSDPRVTYVLHEVGEESRHSRLFGRLLEQLAAKARDPLDRAIVHFVEQVAVVFFARRPALMLAMVLGGEEITDLVQAKAAANERTDPFIVAVNRYHRQEEARHIAFARLVLPEVWAASKRQERFAIRHLLPKLMTFTFSMLVHPGVYKTVGLPGWATWRTINASSTRIALRHEATRPMLDTLVDLGLIARGRVPRAWRTMCGVDRNGRPVVAA